MHACFTYHNMHRTDKSTSTKTNFVGHFVQAIFLCYTYVCCVYTTCMHACMYL